MPLGAWLPCRRLRQRPGGCCLLRLRLLLLLLLVLVHCRAGRPAAPLRALRRRPALHCCCCCCSLPQATASCIGSGCRGCRRHRWEGLQVLSRRLPGLVLLLRLLLHKRLRLQRCAARLARLRSSLLPQAVHAHLHRRPLLLKLLLALALLLSSSRRHAAVLLPHARLLLLPRRLSLPRPRRCSPCLLRRLLECRHSWLLLQRRLLLALCLLQRLLCLLLRLLFALLRGPPLLLQAQAQLRSQAAQQAFVSQLFQQRPQLLKRGSSLQPPHQLLVSGIPANGHRSARKCMP